MDNLFVFSNIFIFYTNNNVEVYAEFSLSKAICRECYSHFKSADLNMEDRKRLHKFNDKHKIRLPKYR